MFVKTIIKLGQNGGFYAKPVFDKIYILFFLVYLECLNVDKNCENLVKRSSTFFFHRHLNLDEIRYLKEE